MNRLLTSIVAIVFLITPAVGQDAREGLLISIGEDYGVMLVESMNTHDGRNGSTD
jgi:hypothetical protein